MRVFVYGTLRDPDLRRQVVGERAPRIAVRQAWRVGYRRIRAEAGNYPVLVRRTGRRVPGLLAERLCLGDLLRIAHFEGANYAPARVRLLLPGRAATQAWSFLAAQPGLGGGRAWRLGSWRARDKGRVLRRIALWMSEYNAGTFHSPDIDWPTRRWLLGMVREVAAEDPAAGTRGRTDSV